MTSQQQYEQIPVPNLLNFHEINFSLDRLLRQISSKFLNKNPRNQLQNNLKPSTSYPQIRSSKDFEYPNEIEP